jgi:hypothetical protein
MTLEEFLSENPINRIEDLKNPGLFEVLMLIVVEKQKERNVFESAIQHFGVEAQLRQLQEECAETISAVNRHLRFCQETYFADLVEELVDTQIVLDQIKLTIPTNIYRNAYNKKYSKLMNLLSLNIPEKGFPKTP